MLCKLLHIFMSSTLTTLTFFFHSFKDFKIALRSSPLNYSISLPKIILIPILITIIGYLMCVHIWMRKFMLDYIVHFPSIYVCIIFYLLKYVYLMNVKRQWCWVNILMKALCIWLSMILKWPFLWVACCWDFFFIWKFFTYWKACRFSTAWRVCWGVYCYFNLSALEVEDFWWKEYGEKMAWLVFCNEIIFF